MSKTSFYETRHFPYYIYAVEFTQKPAGIRALHYLCHALNKLGAEAYLIGCQTESEKLRTPILKESDVLRHEKSGVDPIMVYPEVVLGNPLNMPHIVRWLLNSAGHLGGIFDESELVYAYTDDYSPKGQTLPLLNIAVADNGIFNNDNNPDDMARHEVCFYAHKYLAKGYALTEHATGATSLCQDQILSPEEIAAILRRSKYLYCYEPTALLTEAILCGCPVIMVDTPYLEEYDTPSCGIAISNSPEEIDKAKAETQSFINEYGVYLDKCWQQINAFHEDTQTLFLQRKIEKQGNNEWVDSILSVIEKVQGSTAKPTTRRSLNNKRWLQSHELYDRDIEIMSQRMMTVWQQHPSFHLLVMVNADELALLSDTLNSLRDQLYSSWGLTILSVLPQPEAFNNVPENIEWITLSEPLNDAIEKAVNEAELDWVMQIIPGDKLMPHALLRFSEQINTKEHARFIYSDEIEGGNAGNIVFKSGFNLELLRAHSYLGLSVIVRRDALDELDGFTHLAYVSNTDLAFKMYESYGGKAIVHLEDVLYEERGAHYDEDLLRQNELAVRYDHFLRMGLSVRLDQHQKKNTFHITYQHNGDPLVSIIIANKNNANSIARCLDELLANMSYTHYELIIIDQHSEEDDLELLFKEVSDELGEQFTLLRYDTDNYSAMVNNAVTQATGEYVVILSNMALATDDYWLHELLSLVQRESVGAVGARILDEEENVVHAGGIAGLTDDVEGLFGGYSTAEPAYCGRAHLPQEISTLSSACLITSRVNFNLVGGFDETAFANTRYCIADFCLKLKQQGLKNIWTPFTTFSLYKQRALLSNGVSNYIDGAEKIFLQTWSQECKQDEHYNSHLSLRDFDYGVDRYMPITWNQDYHDRPRIMAFPFNSLAMGSFRVRSPLKALSDKGLVEVVMLPNHDSVENCYIPNRFEMNRADVDVVLMYTAFDDDMYRFIKREKEEGNLFIIFSLDDLAHNLPRGNPQRKKIFRDVKYRLRRTLQLCDRLIVSTQPLADEYRELCDDIVIVPNSLDLSRWEGLVSQQGQSKKLRVGWAGAQQHFSDLEILFDVVKETSDKIDWIFFGMCPDEIRSYVKESHGFTSFEAYPEKLASLNLDLAVAPLENHPFNEAKSNLRLLEYGILSLPVICSEIYPYQTHNPPVTRVNNDKEAWLAAINNALTKRDTLKTEGKALQQWVKENYLLEHHIEAWVEALKETL